MWEKLLAKGSDDGLFIVSDHICDEFVKVAHLEVCDVEPADVIRVYLVYKVN